MIKQATNNDFNFIYGLYVHPKVNPFLLYEPMEKAEFQPIFDDLLIENVLYTFEYDRQQIGMFKLRHHSYRMGHIAYLGGVAIHPDFAGKGLGEKMMRAILDFGKEKGVLRMELTTAIFNQKAINLYEKIGFEKEGIIRRCTHLVSEGLFIDEVLMSYLYEM